MARTASRILVFDSGLGGLTVYDAIVRARPDDQLFYAADDAAFPYGGLDGEALIERVMSVVRDLIATLAPDLVVIACNTASTLVLPPLRASYPTLPFVGTVPAIKPAAAASRSRLISVLATPGTVARDYTQGLIREFAGDCEVALVGAPDLARLAEDFMKGLPVADEAITREISPCFVARDGRRTDAIVLACTHYPLLSAHLTRLAPWPVDYIDPAPAIARRVDQLLGPPGVRRSRDRPLAPAIFTSGVAPGPALERALRRFGLAARATASA
ncbi:MAG TPA: glutamate racemase [Roseiarcus sp.]|nr:glutamate racemase [Roseiarcus sp.]